MMNRIAPTDELLNRSFQLAYFILGDRPSSIYAAMAAIDKLKTAAANQDRRLYYTPTGRSAAPALRTKISLSEMHLLQRLVYIETELFERLLESQTNVPRQEDMIIRYIKHLVRITTKHNSFYVSLGLSRLLYNYSTAEAGEIYNPVVQDPDRIRDDYYYRGRKKHLMAEMKDRFGSLIKTKQGLRREERFQTQEDSQQYVNLVRECLIRFTPWESSCVFPENVDPNRDVITPLLFNGLDPDEEHRVELNRIHTLIHPECFATLTRALGMDAPDRRLELPHFCLSSSGSRDAEDRFNPTLLREGELDAIRRYLEKNTAHRMAFAGGELSYLIDGERRSAPGLQPGGSIQLDVEAGSELIEIRSFDGEEEISLSVCALTNALSGTVPFGASAVLENGQKFSFTVEPLIGKLGEAAGATVRIDYRETTATVASSSSFRRVWTWFNGLIPGFARTGNTGPRLAIGVMFLVICTLIALVYLRLEKHSPAPALIAQQNEHQKDRNALEAPTTPIAPQVPANQNGHATDSRSRHAAKPTIEGAAAPEETRSRKPRRPSAMFLAVKRVYIDPLGNDSFSSQLRDMLMQRLQAGGLFSVVTIRNDADAVIKGSVKREVNEAAATVSLEMVNAEGQVIWSLSSKKNGRKVSGEAKDVAEIIVNALTNEKQTGNREKD